MATNSICSRCLRLATQLPRTTTKETPRRAFTSTTRHQPSRRRIHQSTLRPAPSLEASTQPPTTEFPPFSATRGRTIDQPSNIHERALLQPNNLLHSFTNSPAPQIRKRAAIIRQNAYCPHPSHQPTRNPQSPDDPENRKTGTQPPAHVRYECPDCGIPVSCCEEHFASDYESHIQICDTLKQINEDDHDLVSGRFFPEFQYPSSQIEEAQVNMTNWDTLLYSREFNAINDERSMRQATRLLTYPMTIGSILHELSPYSLKDRLTPEGLRSLSGKINPLSLLHVKFPTNKELVI